MNVTLAQKQNAPGQGAEVKLKFKNQKAKFNNQSLTGRMIVVMTCLRTQKAQTLQNKFVAAQTGI